MKRVVISIILVAAMLTAGIVNFISTKEITLSIENDISEIAELYSMGKRESVLLKADDVITKWDRFSSDNIFLTDKDHVLEIALSTVRIKAMAEENNNEILEECSYAERLIELYRNNQTASLGNIF